MTFRQLGVIGCGLIGCSFALAARRAGLAQRIVGFGKSPSTTEEARAAGILDAAAPSALRAMSGSDLVLLAVPVGALPQVLRDIRPMVTPATLVMDVGSTKQNVAQAADAALGARRDAFVPAHPIAGKEVAGFRNAEATLFEGRQVILTPYETTPAAQVERASAAWQALGATVALMTPQQHDTTFAAVSHLPHLLAFAYINGLLAQPEGPQFMTHGGPGFRDFSRIAGGDAALWRDVFLANRVELRDQLAAFRHALDAMIAAMEQGDGRGLAAQLSVAARARSRWQDGAGAA